MSALYEIANDYAKLMDAGLDPEEMADTLDGITGELEDKAANIMAIIKNETAYAEALRSEASNLNDRAKSSENRVQRLREYLANSIKTAGVTSLRAGVHQLSTRAGLKSVEIQNLSQIPVEFVEYETTTKPDKALIKKQLQAGVEVPGATLKTGKPSLIVK